MVKLSPSPEELALLGGLLRKVELFSALSVSQVDAVLKFILCYGFERGEWVFRQGELGDALYIVHAGQVEVSVKRWSLGFSKKVAVLGPGDCFGEMALLERAPRSASVRAAAPSKLFALTRNDFDYFLGENPAFAVEIKKIAERRESEDSRPH